MEKEKLDYMAIQTNTDVWKKILELNPIPSDAVFFEPFAGENTLFDLIETNNKEWTEITKGRNIFDYDFLNSDVSCIYTNPPFKCDIPNKKGGLVYKNSCYFFLEYFMTKFKNLKTIGFLINAKSFCSLTPCRLTKLKKLGFEISSITILNTNYWFGVYYFVVFEKETTNKLVKIIEKTFTEKYSKVC
jgi:hypothetical protein